jgi:hypothetical protein
MDLLIASVADRPELPSTYAKGEDLWPEFMYQDPVGELYFADCREAFPEFVVVAVDPAEPTGWWRGRCRCRSPGRVIRTPTCPWTAGTA